MEINQLLEYAKAPEKIISPVVCDDLLFWASGYLSDYEESLVEVDQVVAQRRLALIETHKTVAKANAYLELDDCFLQQKTIERRIRQLKAFKANVKRRYEILTNRILNKY